MEGIATTDGLHYYLTCEHLDAYGITHPAQLLTLDLTAFFSSTSQILSHPTSQSFTIYPNPTIGIIHLPSQGVKAVAVFDMQGHKISDFRNQNSELEIDLRTLPIGTYVLRITCEDGRERGEVVIVNR